MLGGVLVTGGGQLVAIGPLGDPAQTSLHGGAVHRIDTQLGQDPGTVEHRGRLHQTSHDELEEGLVPDLVEAQRGPCRLDRLDQHR